MRAVGEENPSGEDVFHYLARYVGEAEASALALERHLFVVDAQQVQQRGRCSSLVVPRILGMRQWVGSFIRPSSNKPLES